MTREPAYCQATDRYYWAKTPHAAGPEVLPPEVFDRLPGYDPAADPAAHYSGGAVGRLYYPTAAEAKAALAAAGG